MELYLPCNNLLAVVKVYDGKTIDYFYVHIRVWMGSRGRKTENVNVDRK